LIEDNRVFEYIILDYCLHDFYHIVNKYRLIPFGGVLQRERDQSGLEHAFVQVHSDLSDARVDTTGIGIYYIGWKKRVRV